MRPRADDTVTCNAVGCPKEDGWGSEVEEMLTRRASEGRTTAPFLLAIIPGRNALSKWM
jgi:hypothetical protein